MKKLICTSVMTLVLTTGAFAQADAPAKSTQAVKTTHTVK